MIGGGPRAAPEPAYRELSSNGNRNMGNGTGIGGTEGRTGQPGFGSSSGFRGLTC